MIDNFLQKRNIVFTLSDLKIVENSFRNKIGFVVSEKFNFGVAQNINNLYKDLLLITPFSGKEKDFFDKIVYDRNLLVHHGGIYTSDYAKGQIKHQEDRDKVFFDALDIKIDDFFKSIFFLADMSQKIISSSHHALKNVISAKKIKMDRIRKKALWFLLQNPFDTRRFKRYTSLK